MNERFTKFLGVRLEVSLVPHLNTPQTKAYLQGKDIIREDDDLVPS